MQPKQFRVIANQFDVIAARKRLTSNSVFWLSRVNIDMERKLHRLLNTQPNRTDSLNFCQKINDARMSIVASITGKKDFYPAPMFRKHHIRSKGVYKEFCQQDQTLPVLFLIRQNYLTSYATG